MPRGGEEGCECPMLICWRFELLEYNGMSVLITALKNKHGRTKNRIEATNTATFPFIDSRFTIQKVFPSVIYKGKSHNVTWHALRGTMILKGRAVSSKSVVLCARDRSTWLEVEAYVAKGALKTVEQFSKSRNDYRWKSTSVRNAEEL